MQDEIYIFISDGFFEDFGSSSNGGTVKLLTNSAMDFCCVKMIPILIPFKELTSGQRILFDLNRFINVFRNFFE